MPEDPKTQPIDVNGNENNVISGLSDSTISIDQSKNTYNINVDLLTFAIGNAGPQTDIQITRLEVRLTREREEKCRLDEELTTLRLRKSELDETVTDLTDRLNEASEEARVVYRQISNKEKESLTKADRIKAFEDLKLDSTGDGR